MSRAADARSRSSPPDRAHAGFAPEPAPAAASLGFVAGPDDTVTLTVIPAGMKRRAQKLEAGETRPISLTASATEIDAELAKGEDGAGPIAARKIAVSPGRRPRMPPAPPRPGHKDNGNPRPSASRGEGCGAHQIRRRRQGRGACSLW